MASIGQVHGRKDSRMAQVFAFGRPSHDDKETELEYTSGSDTDTLSLEARNEKEVRENPNQLTADAQEGQRKAEAAALVWGGKGTAIAIYAWVWVCLFMLALQSSIGLQVLFYAYSSFSSAPQVATAGILAQIVGGVLKLPIAKILNIWGRAEGLLVFVAIFQIGIIIIASCNGPNGYAAGYTLYWVGYNAIYLILDVFVADTSGLKNRAFAFAFISTPFICTAFTGPLAAQHLLAGGISWRWAYGIFAIVNIFIFCPLAFVFKYFERKAKKQGLLVKQDSGRSMAQSIIHYIHEFDAIGALILMAAFILFLLPFSLNTYGRAGYSSPTFIAMVVVGLCLFPVFAVWERFFARVHFIRWELFKQRTVLGACCLAAILFFSFYCWDLYYYYFVQVVFNLPIAYTGYMTQIYNIGSCFWGVVFGVYIRITKHFKYACLFFGLPLMFIGAGLLIHFRGTDQGIGGVIGAQILIAFAGGTLVIGEDMAVMASADRDGVPLMLSLIGLFSSLGGAIGYAVAAAINANIYPTALRSRLPAETAGNWSAIYLGGATTQITYLPGTQTRVAIDYAWGESQRYGSIAATAVLVLAIPAIAVWKNYNVDKKQNKGAVF